MTIKIGSLIVKLIYSDASVNEKEIDTCYALFENIANCAIYFSNKNIYFPNIFE